MTRLADVCLNDPVSIHVSGAPCSDLATTSAVTRDPEAASQSESFAVPEALKQFVVVVPSKVRLVCLAAFILDKCKVNSPVVITTTTRHGEEGKLKSDWSSMFSFQFSQNDKLIVFISSCEAVEFLHSLFTAVLSRPSANHKPLRFLRLHGNMKQEVMLPFCHRFCCGPSLSVKCMFVFPTRTARRPSSSFRCCSRERCSVRSVSFNLQCDHQGADCILNTTHDCTYM